MTQEINYSNELSGKLALVTGGTKGAGKAIAKYDSTLPYAASKAASSRIGWLFSISKGKLLNRNKFRH